MDQPRSASRRKSLTKRQLDNPEALELLSLLQTVTEDGRLLDAEIGELVEWLRRNEGSDLPAVEHLSSAVRSVLADGRVSDEERAWLHKAVETVLPRQEREYAAMRRREASAADREETRVKNTQEAELRKRSKPVGRFDFMVAGTRHDGRGAVIRESCAVGMAVTFVRELGNPYSRNAILIRLSNGQDIGYVPEAEAERLAPLLDAEGLYSAEIKKILQGRSAPIPVVWGELYARDAPVPDARPPLRIQSGKVREDARTGCGAAAVVVLALGGVLAWL